MERGEILAVLRGAAEGTRAAERFEFIDWCSCAAGQVFRATVGRPPMGVGLEVAQATDPVYASVLGVILLVNPPAVEELPEDGMWWEDLGSGYLLSHRVSTRAAELARGGGRGENPSREDYQAASVAVIEQAIRFLERGEDGDE